MIITTFRGRALEQYMKLFVVPVGIPQKTLDQIRTRFIDEFKKPKSESQCIIEIKEIKQFAMESIWDFDQRFKTLMAKVSFQMSNV